MPRHQNLTFLPPDCTFPSLISFIHIHYGGHVTHQEKRKKSRKGEEEGRGGEGRGGDKRAGRKRNLIEVKAKIQLLLNTRGNQSTWARKYLFLRFDLLVSRQVPISY